MKCGREPNGRNEKLGICPAAEPNAYNDVNNGRCGGRFCWNFAGTFCEGEVQGSVAVKLKNCLDCGFFKLVKEEEGQHFKFHPDEMKKK
jgi:hypothetical protein